MLIEGKKGSGATVGRRAGNLYSRKTAHASAAGNWPAACGRWRAGNCVSACVCEYVCEGGSPGSVFFEVFGVYILLLFFPRFDGRCLFVNTGRVNDLRV